MIAVSEVNITPIKATNGLIGFASCVINEQLYISSLGVYKRLDGTGYRITYPTKKIGSRQLNYFHPLSQQAGNAIEQAIALKCSELFERSDDTHGRYSKTTTKYS